MDRDDNGVKQTVRVEILGQGTLKRQFRNKGEAIAYLQNVLDYTKDEIKRLIKFRGA